MNDDAPGTCPVPKARLTSVDLINTSRLNSVVYSAYFTDVPDCNPDPIVSGGYILPNK